MIWHRVAGLGGSTATFLGELGWRDYAQNVILQLPAYGATSAKAEFEHLPWREGAAAEADLAAWQQGRTGYPIVDAGMRELWTTGWMHNRVRMVVASFLVKDLHLDWRRGAAWFLRHLVDGDIVIWVGWDPRFNTAPPPPFWETLPASVRTFLTDVHPGFTMLDGESYGLAQPSYMSTFAAWTGFPDGIPDWDTPDRIASTNMLWLTTNGGDTAWCTSPELEVGQVAVNFEGDFSVSELGPELDQLMLQPLRL